MNVLDAPILSSVTALIGFGVGIWADRLKQGLESRRQQHILTEQLYAEAALAYCRLGNLIGTADDTSTPHELWIQISIFYAKVICEAILQVKKDARFHSRIKGGYLLLSFMSEMEQLKRTFTIPDQTAIPAYAPPEIRAELERQNNLFASLLVREIKFLRSHYDIISENLRLAILDSELFIKCSPEPYREEVKNIVSAGLADSLLLQNAILKQ